MSEVVRERRQRALDLCEQIVVSVLYAWFVARIWPHEISVTNWFPLLILPSEGLVVVLLVFRRPTNRISQHRTDWLIGAAGTFLVLAIRKGGVPIWLHGGAVLCLFGLAVQVGAKLSLWRSFGVVAANRGVKSCGLYKVVRHPMYCGYIIAQAGYLLLAPSVWNLSVYLAAWSLLLLRINAEERVLSADPLYCELKARVRYRLLPKLY